MEPATVPVLQLVPTGRAAACSARSSGSAGSSAQSVFNVHGMFRVLLRVREHHDVEAVKADELYAFLRDHRERLKPPTLNRLLRLLDRW